MTYPATNLNEAVGLIVPDSNAFHEVINGEATETVTLPEGGTVPTLRKAITDSLLFKNPIAWSEGNNETDLLQLRTFTDSLIYWAPTATVSNPIPMGATPVGDSNWKLAPLAISKEAIDKAEERAIGTGVSIYRGSNGSYVQNGDTVPVGTTHLSVLINGKVENVAMSPVASGSVSLLTDSSATIGGTPVTLYVFRNGGYQATNIQLQSITPRLGEQWFNTTDNSIHMGDGVTQGGIKQTNAVNVKAFGAKGDGVTDDTAAIKAAIQHGLDTNRTVVFPTGYYLYDNSSGSFFIDTRPANNFKILGDGFARIVVSGSLNNDYTFNVASKSSRLNFYLENIDIHYAGSQDDVGGIVVTRNGIQNTSEWGGTCSMYRVWMARFTRTNLYLKRNYLSTFRKCEFTGADEGVYDTGNLLPAVAGADSSCVYITGGDDGDTEKDFTNCCMFEQCEFQGAKYGVEGYHIRQTDFNNCVFQYCWIGLSNVVDNIKGAYNLGDISLSGTNYFEYIANRALADKLIADDGTTIIDPANRTSTFTSTAKVEFNAVNTVQLQVRTGALLVSIPNNSASEVDLMNLGREDNQDLVVVNNQGITSFKKGVDFSATERIGDNNQSSILDDYSNLPDVTTSGIGGSVTNPTFASGRRNETTIGHMTFASASGSNCTANGSGNVRMELSGTNTPRVFHSCRIVKTQGGTDYNGNLYPVLSYPGGNPVVTFYKDSSLSLPLTYADLDMNGATLVVISVSFENRL